MFAKSPQPHLRQRLRNRPPRRINRRGECALEDRPRPFRFDIACEEQGLRERGGERRAVEFESGFGFVAGLVDAPFHNVDDGERAKRFGEGAVNVIGADAHKRT